MLNVDHVVEVKPHVQLRFCRVCQVTVGWGKVLEEEKGWRALSSRNPRIRGVTKLELGDCCASGLVCWNEPVDILIFFRLTFDNTLLDEE